MQDKNNESPFASAPLRLRLDGDALVSNWRALDKHSGAARCGAAVKADGYGLGASQVVKLLSDAGCRDFFVAHWSEAVMLSKIVDPAFISVLNGAGPDDMPVALSLGARPVLNSAQQIRRWKIAGGGDCHVMIDSGINRLGIGPEQIDPTIFDGLQIDILASHLASADEDSPQNQAQLQVFREASHKIDAKRLSFANSAGIMLGDDYHFDLTRPGLALYGGIARPEMDEFIRQVVYPQAQILQLRTLSAGASVGYNATYKCLADMQVATIAMGYADGYFRSFSGKGAARYNGQLLPVIGRVSMDLVTLDASGVDNLAEGDWVDVDFSLTTAAALTGMSQYELLTSLGRRSMRVWA
ncbi:alanine racemase [Sphingorhabdus arenilitoris]|uniref:Alanine racemase n=1 Tax=Sphingorhabdus arenilitoris TaxID=1490041 RepID=A0ABV8RFU9_9SPHN